MMYIALKSYCIIRYMEKIDYLSIELFEMTTYNSKQTRSCHE
jgi:hypothetical protein